MSAPMLEAVGVSKLFGQVRALNEVDLTLGPGVTGLLGPNGSGKSTLLKLFSGQLLPDAGQVRLLGRDPFRDAPARRAMGLCPEQDKFYEELDGYRFIEVLTRLHGFSAAESRDRAAHALARVGMATDGKKRLAAMSRGMRQRTKIAQAIAHDPPVVLLDEPLNGADPVARADLVKLVRQLGDEGRCVVVSSHVLHEVEAMTHQVVFIRFGRLRAHGDVFRLRGLLTDRPYRIRVKTPDARGLATRLLALEHVRSVTVQDEGSLELTTTALEPTARATARLAEDLGLAVSAFSSPDADLEALYRYLMEAAG
ncbi:MAG: ABC transporter ATP-binding protein [Myxococcales bacterium]|nr:ABC transporter ATP-binding protein [Myxococcales bacterium]